MVLYLAEKKILAEAIADALPGTANTSGGVIYKGDNVVTWLSGHLLALKDPEDYNPDFKKWDISVLPIFFENWENKPGKGNEDRVKQIGELIKKADTIVNCGDVDEEGQLLVDEMLRWFHYTGPCKRLDTANTTIPALKKALSRMKNNSDMENDGWSAYARQVSDMVFGINLTRYYTKKYNALLTVGRVQTPTLGLVVNRDLQIESHKKIYYYTLGGDADIQGKSFNVKYIPDKELPELTDGKFLSDSYLNDISKQYAGKTLNYTVKKEKEKESAPLPFNLTELNNQCGRRWNYNPDRVMRITQSLRDDYSAITYNRSDCQYLSSEHFREAPGTIKAACKNLSMDEAMFDPSIKSRCFNDANITAHFAIIPTETDVDVSKLSTEQKNVYELICMYYLAQFMPPCLKEKTTLSASLLSDGKSIGRFENSEKVILSPGFYSLLKPDTTKNSDDEEDEAEEMTQGLSALPAGRYEGVIHKESDFHISKKVTKPPKRYTQTDLYDDMTRISKYVDDPKIRELLKEKDKEKKGENGSIGTSATRAEIIKKLITVGYLEEQDIGKKKILISTQKGRAFYRMLPDSVKKADMTALWWVVQEDIKAGNAEPSALIGKVLETVTDIIKGITKESAEVDMSKFARGADEKPLCKCPNCKGDIIKGKFGPYCKNKCGFTMGFVGGRKVNDTEFVYLCQGKKIMMKGLKKKAGGTFDAYVQAKGVEDYTYEKDGKTYNLKRLKTEFTFPSKRR